jgi:hypothetical protein
VQPFPGLRYLRVVNEGKRLEHEDDTTNGVDAGGGGALLAAATAVAGWDREESFDET